MIYRRDFIGSRCRQCGHKFADHISRCPSCGFRTGVYEPIQEALRDPLRHSFGAGSVDAALSGVGEQDPDELDPDNITLAPAIERPPDEKPWFQIPKLRKTRKAKVHALDGGDEDDAEADESDSERASASGGRSFSLETMMVAVTVISICLAISNLSRVVGFMLLAISIPAFWRTLVAIRIYQRRLIGCERSDIVGIFMQSLLLAVMPLPLAGLVWLVVNSLALKFAEVIGFVTATVVPASFAAVVSIVLMAWMVQRVWPVEVD